MKKDVAILILIYLCIVISPIALFSQKFLIKGVVVDKITKEPIKGATVAFDLSNKTITDEKGVFNIYILNKGTKTAQLKFSSVSYQTIDKLCDADNLNQVEMNSLSKTLDEVIISNRAKSIIEMAIDNLPRNYSNKNTALTGIMRIFNTIDTNYYYKGDGVVTVFIDPYSLPNSKQKVYLIQNKSILIQDPRKDYSLKGKWVGGYSNIGDIVFEQPNYIQLSKLHEYIYHEPKIILLNDRKTYEIFFESRKENKTEGLIFVDSATYAFVRIDVTKQNTSQGLGFIPASKENKSVTYVVENKKWRIRHSRQENIYNNKIVGTEIVEFIAITADTSTLTDKSYNDFFQKMDENSKVNKVAAEKDWIVYDSLIRLEESKNNLTILTPPAIDTTVKITRNSVVHSIVKYIIDDNIRIEIGVDKSPVKLSQPVYKMIAAYGLYAGISARLYRSLFFRMASIDNLGTGGASNKSRSFLFANEFIINKEKRPISFIPFTGYNYIKLKDKKTNERITFSNWETGLAVAIEQTRTRSFFIGGSYYNPLGNQENNLSIANNRYSLCLGFVFKY